MKAFFKFATALFFLSGTLTAQTLTQSGTVELGGDISFSSVSQSQSNSFVSDNNNSVATFSFNPYIGYMVSNGFELGFMPGITTQSSGGQSATILNLFFAPSFNVNVSGTVYPYLEFLIGYNSIKGTNGRTTGGLGVGLDAGLKVNIKGNSLLLFKIQYLNQTFSESDYTITSYYGTPIAVQGRQDVFNTVSFGIGFRIFIESKGRVK